MTNDTFPRAACLGRPQRWLLLVAAGVAVAATLAMGLAAGRWIAQPFPGFFVLPNRVIPSVGLPGWAGSHAGSVYQRVVVAVDGQPVSDARGAYEQVARQPAGAPITYTLRAGAATETLTLPSARFSGADYWLIFGSYLGTGLLYLLLAIAGAWCHPTTHLGRALFAVGSTGGLYALSGAALYGAGAPFAVHALAEACFPAAFVYLAVAFPGGAERLIVPIGAVAAWLSIALAVPYLLLLDHPGAYSTFHAACETYLGFAGLALTARLIVEAARGDSAPEPLLRPAVTGALLGLGVPGTIMMLSGIGGGVLPVNVMTATAFLFPVSLGAGLLATAMRRRTHAPVAYRAGT